MTDDERADGERLDREVMDAKPPDRVDEAESRDGDGAGDLDDEGERVDFLGRG